jgi:4-alpha-glucanotransferase
MRNLHEWAVQAGIEPEWWDVSGERHEVRDETLQAIVDALWVAPAGDLLEPLVTADVGTPVRLRGRPGPCRIRFEDAGVWEGEAEEAGAGYIMLPAIRQPGYHQLESNSTNQTIAAAPLRAFTLDDAAGGEKLWGLAVQLYSLRRAHDGGIGDFQALDAFVRHATRLQADAIAISPAHAQFSADVTRFAPYAPSHRAALNVMHIPVDVPEMAEGSRIDWAVAGAARLAALRARFAAGHDVAELARFRDEIGPGVKNHAAYETLSANFASVDFRTWPAGYQDPTSNVVQRFLEDHETEMAFHLWLQLQADKALAAVQKNARDGGAKIGLIADLAVGTDPGGSHSWSRQGETLRGLEIGAPPDHVNREGQGWGITAFSPLGLRRGGFAPFIDMLRHALRHAGGVRIDHVMGLARLWVIPHGASPTEGAYLRMPSEDLLRLVRLESQRHRAVILGEDLGTLPHGYQHTLEEAGIAGLRVMWFEREGLSFTPPARWSRSAVAMTSTHDLPTVAGWWEGTDIGWREKLGMKGDDEASRAAERPELWKAFMASGATHVPMPGTADGAAAADAACGHLGRAASTLALLPIEDALGLTEQPNLPGTTDEHPNWRRRLPGDAETLFGRADVQTRLAAINEARRK